MLKQKAQSYGYCYLLNWHKGLALTESGYKILIVNQTDTCIERCFVKNSNVVILVYI